MYIYSYTYDILIIFFITVNLAIIRKPSGKILKPRFPDLIIDPQGDFIDEKHWSLRCNSNSLRRWEYLPHLFTTLLMMNYKPEKHFPPSLICQLLVTFQTSAQTLPPLWDLPDHPSPLPRCLTNVYVSVRMNKMLTEHLL